MSDHSHGAKAPSSMVMGSGGLGMLDTSALMSFDFPLALARFLGGTMDPNGFNVMHTIDGGLCRNCTVLGVKMDVVFENGTRADISSGVYLHHIISMNIVPDRKLKTNMISQFVSFCGGQNWLVENAMDSALSFVAYFSNVFNEAILGFGAVDEFKQMFTSADGKFDSGFYLGPKDKQFYQAEAVNYRKEPQSIYLQMDTEYQPGNPRNDAQTSFTTTTSKLPVLSKTRC
jgi:hypothetical protein